MTLSPASSLPPWHQSWGTPGPWGRGGARGAGSQGALCCPFPPTASYQQGVLSATILYEILLGKATLYAILVSVLALMAKVRRQAGRGGQAGGRG